MLLCRLVKYFALWHIYNLQMPLKFQTEEMMSSGDIWMGKAGKISLLGVNIYLIRP